MTNDLISKTLIDAAKKLVDACNTDHFRFPFEEYEQYVEFKQLAQEVEEKIKKYQYAIESWKKEEDLWKAEISEYYVKAKSYDAMQGEWYVTEELKEEMRIVDEKARLCDVLQQRELLWQEFAK